MLTTSPPTVFSRWIDYRRVSADADLEARYLGDDIDETCAAAADSGDARILASAVHPLETRREAFAAWRVKQVATLLAENSDFREFYDKAGIEDQQAICDGRIALARIDGLISTHRAELERRRADAREESKKALRAGMLAALRDCDGTETGPIVPNFLAILENGEVGLFRKRAACVAWARASGGRFFMGNFEPGTHRIERGPEVD